MPPCHLPLPTCAPDTALAPLCPLSAGFTLHTWRVFPLQLDSVSSLSVHVHNPAEEQTSITVAHTSDATGAGLGSAGRADGVAAASRRRLLGTGAIGGETKLQFGGPGRGRGKASPMFYR
jgi:hypothetical protein